MSKINDSVNHGVRWLTITKISASLIGLIKISILVRFLDPSAFGLMALVTVVLGFLNLFVDMGITSAILYKQEISRAEYNSLFWLSMIFGLIIYLILFLLSPIIATFYNEPQLTNPIKIASLCVIISGLGRQFLTIDQKQLRFNRISIIEFSSSVISLFVAIYLAIKGFGVYALVYSMIAQFLVTNLIYLAIGIRESKLGLCLNIIIAWPFLKIGLYQVSAQAISYINKELDVILIGKIFGTEILGGYSLAKQLVNRPTSIVNPIINRIATPTLALIQSDSDKVSSIFFNFTRLVSTINIITYVSLAIFAKQIVEILYGIQYSDIIYMVQGLCIYMYLRSLGNPLGSLVIALGKTELGLYWNIYTTFFIPLTIFYSSKFGISGVITGLIILELFFILTRWYLLVNKLLDSNIRCYFTSHIPSFNQIRFLMKGQISID